MYPAHRGTGPEPGAGAAPRGGGAADGARAQPPAEGSGAVGRLRRAAGRALVAVGNRVAGAAAVGGAAEAGAMRDDVHGRPMVAADQGG